MRVRLDIRRTTQIKEGEEVIGSRVKVKVVKNKCAAPFRQAEFDVAYGEGISKTGELIDIGLEHRIIEKSGSWFSYGDVRIIGHIPILKKINRAALLEVYEKHFDHRTFQ